MTNEMTGGPQLRLPAQTAPVARTPAAAAAIGGLGVAPSALSDILKDLTTIPSDFAPLDLSVLSAI